MSWETLEIVCQGILQADMAELADALDLGSSGLPVQVQVLLSAVNEKYRMSINRAFPVLFG